MIDNDSMVVVWNENNPIGTKVNVTMDDKSVKQTKTRSAAWPLCGTPVVLLEGISGGYMLSRVEVIK